LKDSQILLAISLDTKAAVIKVAIVLNFYFSVWLRFLDGHDNKKPSCRYDSWPYCLAAATAAK